MKYCPAITTTPTTSAVSGLGDLPGQILISSIRKIPHTGDKASLDRRG